MKKNTFILFGGIGFFAVLTLNLIGNYLLDQPAAIPFQKLWWSSWFPVYICCFVFFTIGLGFRISKKIKS